MSRHRNVRNLDYDELLDDEAGEDEISAEDNAQWDRSVDEITRRLGSESFQVSEVRDAAWHYYFDVDKATNYLLQKRANEAAKAQKAAASPAKGKTTTDDSCMAADTRAKAAVADKSVGPEPATGAAQPVKKLSKIQQLARDRAAKKAALKTAPANDTIEVASSAAPVDDIQMEDAPEPAPVQAQPIAEAPQLDPDPPLDLAPPSAFAQTLAGLHDSSTSYPHADMLFAVTGKPKGPSLGISFAKPSPDDVVQQAQSKSKAMKEAKPEVKKAEVQEPKPKTVVALRPRRGRPTGVNVKAREVSLVVVGHVDAGKSTLFGRLLYDVGQIDERSMSKLRKESESINKSSFAFAWAMDSSSEERARGVTIDVAQTSFTTGDLTVNILDAPGHRDFVPNMIAGASQADLAVLVVDSSRGSFESGFEQGGQTKEHAILIRALGIQNVLVAVNKLDSVDWSKERFIDIETQLSVFLKATGFEEKAITYVPCSGLTGENVIRPALEALKGWYKGGSLLDAMKKAAPLLSKDATKPFRMLLSDVYPTANSSSVTVTGRVSSGEVQAGDQVVCMPSKELAVVKTLLVADESAELAFAGDNVVMTLADVDAMYLRAGDVLCHASSATAAVGDREENGGGGGGVQNAQKITARIVTFQILQPLLKGSSLVLHRGRLDVPVVVRGIYTPSIQAAGVGGGPREGVFAGFKQARHVLRNAQAIVELELRNGTIPMEPFASNKDVGRVILRREGATVAAGVVLACE